MNLGDEAFDEAYPALFRRAASLAYRLLADKAAAEDIAAEALARTYAQWPRIGALPHREGWVLRVTTNLAIDTTRRKPRGIAADAPPTRLRPQSSASPWWLPCAHCRAVSAKPSPCGT